MFFFILCFFVLVPFSIGLLLSLVLRELYQRQLWEDGTIDQEEREERETTQGSAAVKLYDSSLDEENEKNPDNIENQSQTEENIETVSTDEPIVTVSAADLIQESLLSSVISESEKPNDLDSPQPETTSQLQETENNPPSVFADQNSLPDILGINNVLDEMVNENPPVIPADLSLRIEEDGSPESRFHQMEQMEQMEQENEQNLFESDDQKILTQITASTDSTNQPSQLPELSFNNNNNNNNNNNDNENSDAVRSDIAPMAIELLGEDFNFDSFFDKETKSQQAAEEPIAEKSVAKESIAAIREIGQGIYQAEGGLLTNDQTLLEQLPKKQEIVSLYPDNLIQNAVAEPEQSEIAQRFSFTEESLPMLVRKKNKK
ncbi:MAG: hypothetical protein LBQ50_11810 [Planctomycetaceae bacterium]|nr:hypothetical protein [Planctomycetaceae bacterium]